MNSKVKDSKVLAAFQPGEQLDTAQVLSRVHCMSETQVFRSMVRLRKRGFLQRVWDDEYQEIATYRNRMEDLKVMAWHYRQLGRDIENSKTLKLNAADAV